jgi:hypothetical protein
VKALGEWENFYVIVGSAGALIGLRFVVITLIAERPASNLIEMHVSPYRDIHPKSIYANAFDFRPPEQFEKFVKTTGHVTIAERTPTKEEFLIALAENLIAGEAEFAFAARGW